MTRHAERAGPLCGALGRSAKVTRSYWPGLFACYDRAGLPRTNNDLEHLFGSHRYYERRSSGRKVASAGLVIRGGVRVPASLATRLRGELRGEDSAPSDLETWRKLRFQLKRRQEVRAQGRRFRRDPATYLQGLEDALIKKSLPSWFFSGPGGMVMGSDAGAIEDQPFQIGVLKRLEDPLPNSLLQPAVEAPPHPVRRAGPLGQVSPRSVRLADPEESIEEKSVVLGRDAGVAGLAGQERLETTP